MINLFETPSCTIDTSSFDHLLHGSVVQKFEESFCEYVGAKYGCSINSATSAIFLTLKMAPTDEILKIPSIIPPVVPNAIIHSGHTVRFTDDVDWVGHSYLLHDYGWGKIIDSAQRVDRGQFSAEADDKDIMIFSFYPTKPVASCDGGMVVSNNEDIIESIRTASMNGMTISHDSWERVVKFPGYKMYMNSIQAHMAFKSLMTLDDRKEILAYIRDYYNKELGYNNTSDHLYRIKADSNEKFISHMKTKGISCGIHYKAVHLMDPYRTHRHVDPVNRTLPKSEYLEKITVSLPFHVGLMKKDMEYVVGAVQDYDRSEQ